jgi:hypothetical protein
MAMADSQHGAEVVMIGVHPSHLSVANSRDHLVDDIAEEFRQKFIDQTTGSTNT